MRHVGCPEDVDLVAAAVVPVVAQLQQEEAAEVAAEEM